MLLAMLLRMTFPMSSNATSWNRFSSALPTVPKCSLSLS